MAPEPTSPVPLLVPVGANPARVFGLDAETRLQRLGDKASLEFSSHTESGRPAILADLAFAWDPAWLSAIKSRPGVVLMKGNRAVLAHVPAGHDPAQLADALGGGSGADAQPGDAGRRHPLRRHLLPVDEGHLLAGRGHGLRLHGARHGRRQAGSLHRPVVEMGQYLRPRPRPRPPTLLVV